MSYILDALRRAQAQRDHGGVPNIHALPQASAASLPPASFPRARLWWALPALAAVALLGWWVIPHRDGLREPTTREVVTIAPQMPAAVAPAVAAAPTTPVAPVSPPVSVTLLTPQVAPAPPAAALPSVAVATAQALTKPQAVQPTQVARPVGTQNTLVAAGSRAESAAVPATVAPPTPTVSEPRIYAREELPGDIRGQLPQIRIGGSSYSETPSSRMLIANGQVFYENEKIAPDTTLVQIRPTAAVLSFRGFRFLVPY